jgi:hypothetical protein
MDAKCVEFGWSDLACSAISWGLYFGYFLFGVAILAAIAFPLMNTIKNPGSVVKSGIGIGVLLVVFFISYALADSDVSVIAKSLGWGESSVKLIGAGLIMFYITLFGAIIGLIYSEISKAFK